MLNFAGKLVRTTDTALAGAYLSICSERKGLVGLLFHSLFSSEKQIELNHVNPLQRTTVESFARVLRYFQGNGYRFISAEQLLQGLEPDEKYAVLTFDDGYYNNRLALPVLEALNIPAIFFIATDNVEQRKSFWWDVLYRNRIREGAGQESMAREGRALKTLTTEQMESNLIRLFGPRSFDPLGDIDRAFAPAELAEFSRHPLVTLGNHTANHAILVNYDREAARGQIVRAQESLQKIAGVVPKWIAYPNGDYSEDVARLCGEAGLRGAFTVRARKTPVPPPAEAGVFHVGRFSPDGNTALESQCRSFRSNLAIYDRLHERYLRWRRNSAGAGRGVG